MRTTFVVRSVASVSMPKWRPSGVCEFAKGDVGILERCQVAVKHRRGANLAAYSVLAGDRAIIPWNWRERQRGR